MKTRIAAVCIFIFSISLSAQERLNIGSFRVASMVGPLPYYFEKPTTVQPFATLLDSILYRHIKAKLVAPEKIYFEIIDSKSILTEKFNRTSLAPAISMAITEFSPSYLVATAPPSTKEDSAFLNGVLSCIQISLQITNQNGSIKLRRDIEVYIKKRVSSGIGLPITNLALSEKGLLAIMEQALPYLCNPEDSLETLEITAPPLYAADNFILKPYMGKPRVLIELRKNNALFTIDSTKHIIRWNMPSYQEIILSGKNKKPLNDSLLATIKEEKKNLSSVFVYLKQNVRDAIANIDYDIIMPAKISNEITGDGNPATSLRALAGNHHFIISNKDTIGRFSFTNGGMDSTRLFFTHQLSNGIDTASIISISNTPSMFPVSYNYTIKGNLQGSRFTIYIYAEQYIREIWIDDRLIATVFGDIAPEKLVLYTPINNLSLLDFTILFAYQSYFSSKSLTKKISLGSQPSFYDYFALFPLFPLPETYNFSPRVEYHFNN